MLNLSKGETLNLKKDDGTNISKIRVGLAWDVKDGVTMDLDLFIHYLEWKKTAYFGNKTAIAGVKLSDDNLTGEWDGDDEFAKFDATVTQDGKYFICVNIYNAGTKTLSQVLNAVCTVYNDETNEKLAEYKLTEDGGDNTSIVVWAVNDKDDGYTFEAIGTYIKWDINQVVATLA